MVEGIGESATRGLGNLLPEPIKESYESCGLRSAGLWWWNNTSPDMEATMARRSLSLMDAQIVKFTVTVNQYLWQGRFRVQEHA